MFKILDVISLASFYDANFFDVVFDSYT